MTTSFFLKIWNNFSVVRCSTQTLDSSSGKDPVLSKAPTPEPTNCRAPLSEHTYYDPQLPESNNLPPDGTSFPISLALYEDPLPEEDLHEALQGFDKETGIGQILKVLGDLLHSASSDTIFPFDLPLVRELWRCGYKSKDAECKGGLNEASLAGLVSALSTPGQEQRDPEVTAAIIVATEHCFLATGVRFLDERPWEKYEDWALHVRL
jgi:hypothetical protein